VSQDLDCKFLYEHTKATATCMFYINRLLVMSFTEAMATFMIHRLLVANLTEATATSMLYRHPLMVVCDNYCIFPNKIDPFDWFIPNSLDGLA
jgi:hypothetical protein